MPKNLIARWKNDARGSATLVGMLAVMILLLLSAAIVDVYRIQAMRTFGYSVANDAALRGASLGRDWTTFTQTGQLALDPAQAHDAAQAALSNELSLHGVISYTADIRVLPDSTGGTIPNYPPVPRASLINRASWNERAPAVGVYLAIPVDTILFGLVNGNQPITIHAFAAAGVAQAQP